MLSAATPASDEDQPTSKRPLKRKADGVALGLGIPRDLADLSGPSDTGFLAPRPHTAALAALALSEAEVERFTERGYVATSQPVLTTSQLEQLRADLDELVCQQPPHPKVACLTSPCRASSLTPPRHHRSRARRPTLPRPPYLTEGRPDARAPLQRGGWERLGPLPWARPLAVRRLLSRPSLPRRDLPAGQPAAAGAAGALLARPGVQLHRHFSLLRAWATVGLGLKRGLKRGLEPQGPRPSPWPTWHDAWHETGVRQAC
mgnify:CR=1 FL=1